MAQKVDEILEFLDPKILAMRVLGRTLAEVFEVAKKAPEILWNYLREKEHEGIV